jgi:hypothetical protein
MAKNLSIQSTVVPEPTTIYLYDLIKRHIFKRSQITFDTDRSSDLVIHLGLDACIRKSGRLQVADRNRNGSQVAPNLCGAAPWARF